MCMYFIFLRYFLDFHAFNVTEGGRGGAVDRPDLNLGHLCEGEPHKVLHACTLFK